MGGRLGARGGGVNGAGIQTMEAIGLLRAGATPDVAWSEAFGVRAEPDGAPALGGDGSEVAALRAAGRLAHRSGAPLADVLERLEEAQRGRRRAEAAREAALAGPRASAGLLVWLPAVGWVVAVALDPAAARLLAGTGAGWALAVVGGALWWGGRRWLRRLVQRAERAGADAGDVALPLALAEAAVSAGLDVRTAIGEVGRAMGGERGDALAMVEERLALGRPWAQAWEGAPVEVSAVERALRPAWSWGASPAPTLRATREAVIAAGQGEAEAAAARLGVSSTLPLTLCLLPAFIVLGVAPLMLALASGLRAEW